MNDIKFCPVCDKKNDKEVTKCECGYEFVEEKEIKKKVK